MIFKKHFDCIDMDEASDACDEASDLFMFLFEYFHINEENPHCAVKMMPSSHIHSQMLDYFEPSMSHACAVSAFFEC